jgi:chromosomal replication initiation ATPase DnaA
MTRASAHEVVRQVALLHGETIRNVLGPKRWTELVRVRRRVAKLLFDEGMSYPEIGRTLGGRHHTTVMYYLGAIKSRPQEQTP